MADARTAPVRARNDPRQYDDLSAHWWDPHGPFAMLHWLAAARGALVPPPAPGTEPLLVDLGCGAGLLAPHVPGYRHVGVDLTASALVSAAMHGVLPTRGDVTRVPLRSGCADVVAAGEILEHVADTDAAVAEACRLLRPGGLLVIDTLAATALGRFLAVTVAERLRGAPRGIHDPRLFVDRERLRRVCARHGVALEIRGIRPSVRDLVGWLAGRRDDVRMVGAPTSAVLFQAVGRRLAGPGRTAQNGPATGGATPAGIPPDDPVIGGTARDGRSPDDAAPGGTAPGGAG